MPYTPCPTQLNRYLRLLSLKETVHYEAPTAESRQPASGRRSGRFCGGTGQPEIPRDGQNYPENQQAGPRRAGSQGYSEKTTRRREKHRLRS